MQAKVCLKYIESGACRIGGCFKRNDKTEVTFSFVSFNNKDVVQLSEF